MPPNRRNSRSRKPASRGPGAQSSRGSGRSAGPSSSRGSGAPSPRGPKAKPNLSQAQARNVAIVVHDMMRHILETRRPADRELSSMFRRQKKFGSRDRRLVSEALYSVFRWWGWLGPKGRDENRLWTLESEDAADDPSWLMVLLGAYLLDATGEPHPIALRWRDMLQDLSIPVRHIDCLGDRPIRERGEAIAELFGTKTKQWRELAPSWFFQQLAQEPALQVGLIESLQNRPPIWLRVQRGPVKDVITDLKRADLEPKTGKEITNAIRLDKARVNLFDLPSFRDGRFEVQDLASQCIGLACQAKKGERWWDVCAGAGGKSLQLAAMMDGAGLVVATDIRGWKLDDLKKRARRSQLSNITTREFSGEGIPSKKPTFDGVLVDAPCTCTGTWRRNPDARWTTRAEDVAEMAAMQFDILENARQAVKPGGVLVYATCSVMEAENEAVVRRFLEAHPDYALEPIPHPITGETTDGQYRIWPTDADCDATYVARLRHQG